MPVLPVVREHPKWLQIQCPTELKEKSEVFQRNGLNYQWLYRGVRRFSQRCLREEGSVRYQQHNVLRAGFFVFFVFFAVCAHT